MTDWVSPLIATPKKDGNIRIVINMKKANQAIKRKRHYIPTAEQLKQEMHRAVMFSILDLKIGHHQLKLDERSRPITTLATPIGLRRYKRLSLEITSASEWYQHTLEQYVPYGLTGARNKSDDIIVWGKTEQKHNDNLNNQNSFLQQFKEIDLRLNKKNMSLRKALLFFLVLYY